ncbi:hypothetical protein ACFP3U_34435, partial [Kitasatospora misakiensis]
ATATAPSAAPALSAPAPRRSARSVARRAAVAAGMIAAVDRTDTTGATAAIAGTGAGRTARGRSGGGGRREDETSPVVAVDRLFRDGLTDLARSADAPEPEAHHCPEAAAHKLLSDDTVRLGRVTRPSAERSAPGRQPDPTDLASTPTTTTPNATTATTAAGTGGVLPAVRGAAGVPGEGADRAGAVAASPAPERAGTAGVLPAVRGAAGLPAAGVDRAGAVVPVTSDLRSE